MRVSPRGLAAFAALLFLGSGCPNARPPPARIEISPRGAILTPASPTRALKATVYDAAGQVLDVAVTWTSSDASLVEVSASGTATAQVNAGSAVLTAQAGEARTQALVVAAEPASGAVVVRDEDIASAPSPLDAQAPLQLGFRYQVTLRGVAAPPVGALLVGDGEQPVAGRVVAVEGGVVTLELVPLDELFPSLELSARLDLAQAPFTVPEATAEAFEVQRFPDGSARLTARPDDTSESSQPLGSSRSALSTSRFKCESSVSGVQLTLESPSFTVQPALTFDVVWNRSQKKLVVEGEPKVTFEATPTLSAAIEGNVTCTLILLDLAIPFPGPLGLFLGAFLPLGVGFSVGGKVPVASVGAEFKAEAGASVRFGLDCNPVCARVQELTPSVTGSVTPRAPALAAGPEVEAEGYGFLFARLEGGARFSSTLRVEAVEARAGLKLGAKLAEEQTQAFDAAFQGEYQASFEASVGAGLDFQRFLGLLHVNLGALELKYTREISRSPRGEARAGRDRFEVGDPVDFKVDLHPDTVDFFGYGYNVAAVRIYRREAGGLVLANEVAAAPGQTSFTLPWVATVAAPVQGNFVAFVETGLLSSPRFELGEVKPLTPQAGTFTFTRETVTHDDWSSGAWTQTTHDVEKDTATLTLELVDTTADTKRFRVVGGALGRTGTHDFVEWHPGAGTSPCTYNERKEEHWTTTGNAPVTGASPEVRLDLQVLGGHYNIDTSNLPQLTAETSGVYTGRYAFLGTVTNCKTNFDLPYSKSQAESVDVAVTNVAGGALTDTSFTGSNVVTDARTTITTTWNLALR